MAVTLESVMRLNDEFTATLSKYASEIDSAKKKTDEAKVSGTNLSRTFKDIGTQSETAKSGINGIIGKLTGLISTVYLARKAFGFLKESIQTAATQQVQQTTLQSLMGNKQLGTDLYQYVSAYARKSPLDQINVASGTTAFLAYTKNINQIQQLLDLTQRLYSFNPAQGAEGAVFALKEVLSGQTMSLRNRFNMTGISADTIKKNFDKGDIAGTISYLDKEFNKFGATQDVVNANFNSLSNQAKMFRTNLMIAIGDQSNGAVQSLSQTFQRLNADMDAGKFQPFFTLMQQGSAGLANAFSWVAQNANTIAPIMAGAVTALVGYNIAMGAASLANTIFGATAAAATGRVFALIATIGALGVGIAVAKNTLGNVTDKANKEALTTAEAAKQYADKQKALGASTLGNSAAAGTGAATSVPTTVKNKNPIKVSGTVEIQKENLKYVFEAATAKFYAQFNATKVEPTVNIENQNVTQTADVNEIDNALGNIVAGRAKASAGGSY